jgi:hypothetical protein
MAHPYDIYESLPSGDIMWRIGCADMQEVHLRLREFAKTTDNEFCAKDKAKKVVARVNEGGNV